MPYTRISFLIAPVDPGRDILMVELTEIGYDSYEETTGGLDAYIENELFDGNALQKLITLRDPHVTVSWSVSELEQRNWNAEWESSFQPVEVGREVRIRAEHHPAAEDVLVLVDHHRLGGGGAQVDADEAAHAVGSWFSWRRRSG